MAHFPARRKCNLPKGSLRWTLQKLRAAQYLVHWRALQVTLPLIFFFRYGKLFCKTCDEIVHGKNLRTAIVIHCLIGIKSPVNFPKDFPMSELNGFCSRPFHHVKSPFNSSN